MLILSPRNIGQNINTDIVELFIQYSNQAILNGSFCATGFIPSSKVISLSMNLEMVDPLDEKKTQYQTFNLSVDEKSLIERLFKAEGWFTSFTNRKALNEVHDQTNDPGTQDLMHKILSRFAYNYNDDIFILSTFNFFKI